MIKKGWAISVIRKIQVKTTLRYYPIPVLTSKRQEVMSADKGIEGNVTPDTGGIVKWCKHYGK